MSEIQIIWGVSSGSYSDFDYDGFFTTKELAEGHVKMLAAEQGYDNDFEVHEIELNSVPAKRLCFAWVFIDTGEVKHIYYSLSTCKYNDKPGHIFKGFNNDRLVILGRGADEDRAIKSARDHRARYLAEQEGIAMTQFILNHLHELRETADVIKQTVDRHFCVNGIVYVYDALGNLTPMQATEERPIPVINFGVSTSFERDLEI